MLLARSPRTCQPGIRERTLHDMPMIWAHCWSAYQQRQHVVMAVVLVVSGVAEMVAQSANVQWLGLVWPAGLAVIGVMFMVHTQHGTSLAARRAVFGHRILGVSLVAAAIARAAQVILEESSGLWAYLWVIILLLVAIQLIVYREPTGAYESEPG